MDIPVIKESPFYNDPQVVIKLCTASHKMFIGGRGVGKTTIIADQVIDCLKTMPRGKISLNGLPISISVPNLCRLLSTIGNEGDCTGGFIILSVSGRLKKWCGRNLFNHRWIIRTASIFSMDLLLNSIPLTVRRWHGQAPTTG